MGILGYVVLIMSDAFFTGDRTVSMLLMGPDIVSHPAALVLGARCRASSCPLFLSDALCCALPIGRSSWHGLVMLTKNS